MSLDEIKQNIESDTRSKVKQIVDQAGTEAKKIENDAAEEARRYEESAKGKTATDAKQLLVRELSRANIAGKEIYQSAVNDYLTESTATLQKALPGYTRSKDYKKLLGKLARMAASELGEGCTLMLQSQDIKKLDSLKGVKIAKSSEKFTGGLKGESSDGKRSIDYSLENILDSMKESIGVRLLSQVK
jgi:vacuolar-type H+-ATPase subunit E/Vma4